MMADIHTNVRLVVGAVLALLLLGTAATAVLARVRPALELDEVQTRIRSWWVIAGLVTLALILERGWGLFFFAWVSYLALKEYLSLVPTRRADRRVLLWAYCAIPLQYVWIYMGWYEAFLVFIPVLLFLAIPMRMVLIGQTDGFLQAAGTIQWGAMTTVFGISHAAFLLTLPTSINPNGGGPGLLLFLLALTQFNDIAQFLWGKAVGRARVMPAVSPNKTWGGLLGGVGTTVALAIVSYGFLTPFSLYEAVIAGVLIGIFGFIGDVVVSAIKRDLKVKDSGTLIPGHGGILDRLDSLTFTAPLFFHFTWYLYA